MPSFTLDFEVYCATCGAGLCNQSDTRTSRHRGEPQVTVEACKDCIAKSLLPLEEKIELLESQLDDAIHQISCLKAADQ